MPACRPKLLRLLGNDRGSDDSGQAMIEYALSALIMATLLFGVIDFSRAIYQQQTITSLAAQGANLAMRGITLTNTANTVVTQAGNLNLGSNGCVIVSAVYNNNNPNALTITDQQKSTSCGIPSLNSKIGAKNGTATIPPGATPLNKQTVFVAEVFYTYQPITPIGKLIQTVLPTQLYDAAYY